MILAILLALSCGEYRVTQKTLRDNPKLIALKNESKIKDLGNLPRVKDKDRGELERRVYRISGFLKAYKLEADGDIHMVIEDSEGNTLVAEIVQPECMRNPKWISWAEDVSSTFYKHYTPRKRLKVVNPPRQIDLEGVGFFDKRHNQAGMAPNGFELHPVTYIGFRK
jgi:hypothetical protein